MHRALSLSLLLLFACTDGDGGDGLGISGPSGTYVVTWQLGAGRSCATDKLQDVVVTAVDATTNNTVVEMAPCTAGHLELRANVGEHAIDVDVMGTFGDVAGGKSLDGAIPSEGAKTMLPPITLNPTPPTAEVSSLVDTKSYCGPYPAASVVLGVTSTGGTREYTTKGSCGYSSIKVKDVPYGQLTVRAYVLDQNNTVVKTSPSMTGAPVRGLQFIDVTFP